MPTFLFVDVSSWLSTWHFKCNDLQQKVAHAVAPSKYMRKAKVLILESVAFATATYFAMTLKFPFLNRIVSMDVSEMKILFCQISLEQSYC